MQMYNVIHKQQTGYTLTCMFISVLSERLILAIYFHAFICLCL